MEKSHAEKRTKKTAVSQVFIRKERKIYAVNYSNTQNSYKSSLKIMNGKITSNMFIIKIGIEKFPHFRDLRFRKRIRLFNKIFIKLGGS